MGEKRREEPIKVSLWRRRTDVRYLEEKAAAGRPTDRPGHDRAATRFLGEVGRGGGGSAGELKRPPWSNDSNRLNELRGKSCLVVAPPARPPRRLLPLVLTQLLGSVFVGIGLVPHSHSRHSISGREGYHCTDRTDGERRQGGKKLTSARENHLIWTLFMVTEISGF